MMIGSHVHIDAKKYTEGEGVTNILDQAREAGVMRFVAPSLHFESFDNLLKIRETDPQVYPAAGIHPHEASEQRCLDLARKLESVQLASLRPHLAFARVHDLPIILHCRQTEELLYEELRRHPGLRGVVHCFTGTWEWARRFLELGFHIGITGIVTFKNSLQVQEVASNVPQDRLLVETDGPYLAPIPFRGKINKPEYIPLIVKKIAELRGAPAASVAAFTTENTESLFGLKKHVGKGSV